MTHKCVLSYYFLAGYKALNLKKNCKVIILLFIEIVSALFSPCKCGQVCM